MTKSHEEWCRTRGSLTVSHPALHSMCQHWRPVHSCRSHRQMDSTWSQHVASLTTARHCSSSRWPTTVQTTGLQKSAQNVLKCAKMYLCSGEILNKFPQISPLFGGRHPLPISPSSRRLITPLKISGYALVLCVVGSAVFFCKIT